MIIDCIDAAVVANLHYWLVGTELVASSTKAESLKSSRLVEEVIEKLSPSESCRSAQGRQEVIIARNFERVLRGAVGGSDPFAALHAEGTPPPMSAVAASWKRVLLYALRGNNREKHLQAINLLRPDLQELLLVIHEQAVGEVFGGDPVVEPTKELLQDTPVDASPSYEDTKLDASQHSEDIPLDEFQTPTNTPHKDVAPMTVDDSAAGEASFMGSPSGVSAEEADGLQSTLAATFQSPRPPDVEDLSREVSVASRSSCDMMSTTSSPRAAGAVFGKLPDSDSPSRKRSHSPKAVASAARTRPRASTSGKSARKVVTPSKKPLKPAEPEQEKSCQQQ